GSSIAQVYVDSNADYAQVQRIGWEVREAAAAHVLGIEDGGWRMEDSDPPFSILHPPSSVVVLNSLPWERQDIVRIALAGDAAAPELTAPDGAAQLSQVVVGQSGEKALLVETTAPSYGYSVLTSASAASEKPNAGYSKLKTQNPGLSRVEG